MFEEDVGEYCREDGEEHNGQQKSSLSGKNRRRRWSWCFSRDERSWMEGISLPLAGVVISISNCSRSCSSVQTRAIRVGLVHSVNTFH